LAAAPPVWRVVENADIAPLAALASPLPSTA
jgi:hypothetical protein